MNEQILAIVGQILDNATVEQREVFALQLVAIRDEFKNMKFGFTESEIEMMTITPLDIRTKVRAMTARKNRTGESIIQIKADLNKLFKAMNWQ